MRGYRLGAVAYHPRVEQIWREFAAWLDERGTTAHAWPVTRVRAGRQHARAPVGRSAH